VISQDLAEYFQSGISIVVGTRDARLRPEILRGFAARASAGSDEIEVVIPRAGSVETLANLDANGRVAIVFARAADHRSIQIKGRFLARREAREEDRRRAAHYLEELSKDWAPVGIPPTMTRSLTHWPAYVLTVRAERLFDQTPGPNAGAPLGGAGSPAGGHGAAA
jgi:hypothetical protein